jgi:hypothetical protein
LCCLLYARKKLESFDTKPIVLFSESVGGKQSDIVPEIE